MEGEVLNNQKYNFNKILEYCVLALIFLMPIVFFPVLGFSLYSAKIAVLATLIVVFIGVFLGSTLSQGSIEFPKSKIWFPFFGFSVLAILSSVFSGAIEKSLVGILFEFGTAVSLLLVSIGAFLVAVLPKKDSFFGVKSVYAFFISSALVILHLIIRSLAQFLPVALTSRIPDFLVGSATDTSILLGALVVLSIPLLGMFNLSKRVLYLVYLMIAFSLIFIGAIGFSPIIFAIAIFSLFYFVYTLSWSVSSGNSQTDSANKKMSIPALIVLVVSVVFILSGGAISGFLSNKLNLSVVEVRPNFSTTMSLISTSVNKNPALGVGPNMFKELWDLNKPADINQTKFWSTDFSFGSAFVPTTFITVGILGGLALLLFLGFYAYYGFKGIFFLTSDNRLRFVTLSSFLVSLLFWIMSFVYVPGIVIMTLCFIFTGIFISSLVSLGLLGSFKVNVFGSPKTNFVSVFLIVVFLLLSIAGGYFVWERVVASSMFQKGDSLGALRLVKTDVYWRGVSENSIVEMANILGSVSSAENITEQQRLSIQQAVSNAVASAREAIAWNPKNYQNWFALGRVYEILASNGIDGAIENAKSAFSEAETRSPSNPAIPLAFGRLSALSGDVASARENIIKSIQMKNNYTEAYYTLAQLEVASNNISGAIQSVETATLVDPQNPALYFQLGLLKYNNRDFVGSARAFDQALVLVPDYANARYFLGLSLERMNRRDDAIAQFEILKQTNPDNAEIDLILTNLKAGKSPFTDAVPPIDDKPESRTELPVEER